jgi:hypothetical protein
MKKASGPKKYLITASTDGKYLGCQVTAEGVIESGGVETTLAFERLQIIGDGAIRLSNSNYIIEARNI